MSSIKERLTDYLNFKKINVYDFQRALGVSKSYVATISKSIQPDKLERISNLYPDLSIGWLMVGQGEMIYKPSYGGNYAYAIGDGSTNNAVAENNGGDGYTAGSLYIASLREQIEQLNGRIADMKYTIELQNGIINGKFNK